MIHEILTDEHYRATKKIENLFSKSPFDQAEICILSANDPFSSFLEQSFSQSSISNRLVSSPQKLMASSAKMIFFIDSKDTKYSQECEQQQILNLLEEGLKLSKSREDYALILPIIIEAPILKNGIKAISEREYSFYLSQKSPNVAESFYLKIEDLCRAYSKEGANVTILLFTGVYGPDIDLFHAFSFKAFFNEISKTKEISISSEDAKNYYSACSIDEALSALLAAISSKTRGNIFISASSPFSIKDIKLELQKAFSSHFSLNAQIDKIDEPIYHCLSALKLSKYNRDNSTNLNESIYRLGAYYLQKDYDMDRSLSIFEGRLDRLKELQIAMLKDIDSICREHGIQYFLAGGSLLGAIRHHGIIPWDDDLDIAMLRDDFEKFRKICPDALGERYSYESPSKDRNNHYYFDKIRLKDTYLSTGFSDRFKINNGIFLDIVCYDQTGNSKFLTKLQIKTITTAIRFINMKWYNQPRSKSHAKAAKILFPLIKLLPFSLLHWIFETAIRFYEKKKDAKYLIDGMGLNIRKGRFLKEWVDEVEYTDFSGFKAPIPKGYAAYLEHLYGSNYMEMLPISKRCSHSLMRIDLGKYLFTNEGEAHRSVHLDGELFE